MFEAAAAVKGCCCVLCRCPTFAWTFGCGPVPLTAVCLKRPTSAVAKKSRRPVVRLRAAFGGIAPRCHCGQISGRGSCRHVVSAWVV